jgi:hypothetical protein
MNDRFNEGVAFFNAGQFFDAHEAWEDTWRESAEPERQWLQGLVQVAVALHHESTGNRLGANSVLARAAMNLQGVPDDFRGMDFTSFRADIDRARSELVAGKCLTLLRVKRL